MEIVLEKVFAALLFMIGVSQVAEPHAWADFYRWLLGRGLRGRQIYALVSLCVAALIITQHNVWRGPGTILTLLGWACCWTPSPLCCCRPTR